MNKQIQPILIAFFFLFIREPLIAQTEARFGINRDRNDTTSLERRFSLSEHNLDSLADLFSDIMEKGLPIENIKDNIILFRLYNTMSWAQPVSNKNGYTRFKKFLDEKYLALTRDKLHGVISIIGDAWFQFHYSETRGDFTAKSYYEIRFEKDTLINANNFARKLYISEEDFISQMKRLEDIMRKGFRIENKSDYIISFRILNTMFLGSDVQEKGWEDLTKANEIFFERFYPIFQPYINDAKTNLNCVNRRNDGEGCYSFYYNIGLGFESFGPVDDDAYYHIKFNKH